MKFSIGWIVLFSAFNLQTSAQDVYKTISGDIAVSVNYGDTIQLLVSHDLLVLLNYENSRISFKAPYETFKTGVDTIDERLRTMKNQSLDFNGKLSITINPRVFAAQKYILDGFLTGYNSQVAIHGTGSMTCIAPANNSTPACTLLLSFETTLSALHLSEYFPGAKEEVRVDLRQSILERQMQ